MRVGFLASDPGPGGAGRAALRTFEAVRNWTEVDAEFWVRKKSPIDSCDIHVHRGLLPHQLTSQSSKILRRLSVRDSSRGVFSIAAVPWGIVPRLNRAKLDVVNIHWQGDKGLSIEEIGSLEAPLLWTLHDSWMFSGSEHYPPDGLEQGEYEYGILERGSGGVSSLDAWVFRRKLRSWTPKFQYMGIVAPSNWLARKAENSYIGSQVALVSVVPYPVDSAIWFPENRESARHALDIYRNDFAVLFVGDVRDSRKGFKTLQEAMVTLSVAQGAGIADMSMRLLVAGPHSPAQSGLRTNYLGSLGDSQLRASYSAADIVVVPSMQDNFPQVAQEAQACGAVVVVSNAGGLPETVDESSGVVVARGDVRELAQAIAYLAKNRTKIELMRKFALSRARRLWNQRRVAEDYREVLEATAKLP